MFCAEKFEPYLNGKVLDVGCWQKDLQSFLPAGADYLGIDVAGSYDQRVDLEEGKLPFADNAFDCVVCTDVLEHIDSLHDIYAEIIRVTRGYVIISLPNNWVAYKKYLLRGLGHGKYYGLPLQKPDDRHRWFFNLEDIDRFIHKRAAADGYRVVEWFAYPDLSMLPRHRLVKTWLRRIVGKRRYDNWLASTGWAVLQKV